MLKEQKWDRIRLFSGVLLAALLTITSVKQVDAQENEQDVIYVPTPDTVVEKMLQMANVGPGDYVVDLGSGDGRIVIQAAKMGAYGHGIEIDPQRLREARRNAEEAGVQDRVAFIKGDLFKADFSNANVITMYLLRSLNIKLRPKLLDMMEPGTPIVSHSFNMGEWKADKYAEVNGDQVYLWYVPADVNGLWTWSANGKRFSTNIKQEFQEISVTMHSGSQSFTTRDETLKGKRISFIAENGDVRYVYSGEVEGDQITGIVQIHEDGEKKVENWSAERK